VLENEMVKKMFGIKWKEILRGWNGINSVISSFIIYTYHILLAS
jgi:hypothetical protein